MNMRPYMDYVTMYIKVNMIYRIGIKTPNHVSLIRPNGVDLK